MYGLDQMPAASCEHLSLCPQGDILYSNTPLIEKGPNSLQYFWVSPGHRHQSPAPTTRLTSPPPHTPPQEAFPASTSSSDRTTYLFTYLDAHPQRPKLSEIFEDYWDLLPEYQDVAFNDLSFKRVRPALLCWGPRGEGGGEGAREGETIRPLLRPVVARCCVASSQLINRAPSSRSSTGLSPSAMPAGKSAPIKGYLT
jgi:hypothetical protein